MQESISIAAEAQIESRLCRVTKQGFHPILKGALLDLMTPDRRMTVDPTGIYIPTEQGLYRVADKRRAMLLSAKQDFFSLLRTEAGLLAFAADGIYRFFNLIEKSTLHSVKGEEGAGKGLLLIGGI